MRGKKERLNNYFTKINTVQEFNGYLLQNGEQTLKQLEMGLRACKIQGLEEMKFCDAESKIHEVALSEVEKIINEMLIFGYNAWLEMQEE